MSNAVFNRFEVSSTRVLSILFSFVHDIVNCVQKTIASKPCKPVIIIIIKKKKPVPSECVLTSVLYEEILFNMCFLISFFYNACTTIIWSYNI